jgi:omega-6 fatty acid desaturase (delta-12 desaturase)
LNASPVLSWREAVEPFAQPRFGRTLFDLATSVVPYLVLLAVTALALRVSTLLALALAPLTAGFLLRTFIVFHDCTHGSLFASRRANRWLGTALGLLLYTPFDTWAHSHAVHHATAGNLDRRGTGDVPTLTVAEYEARSPGGRVGYRLFRNPVVMFGLGPILSFVVLPRLVHRGMRRRLRDAVVRTNVILLVAVGAVCALAGPSRYLLVQWPAAWLAGAAGVFLFYAQHQFEDAYWQRGETWAFADAAIRGSSYLRLPTALRFFSGNIGFHHIHHLNARVPNYNLPLAHAELGLEKEIPVLSLADALRATRLKLWDERRGRLVTFAQARRPATTARYDGLRSTINGRGSTDGDPAGARSGGAAREARGD